MHLKSALLIAERQKAELLWEIENIDEALEPLGIPFVLLKGAAYAWAQLPIANGRMVSDVDILVPRVELSNVESALMMRGWSAGHRTDHDNRYYRQWMHELPPLKHFQRGSVIDVHHAIVPITGRIKTDSQQLLGAAKALYEHPRIRVLSREDMFLHSATHLFQEGEFHHGFRGLLDLDDLLKSFATDDDFCRNLPARALELNLFESMIFALRYVYLVLGTVVPELLVETTERFHGKRLYRPPRFWPDQIFMRALSPYHSSLSDLFTVPAQGLLFLRSHWLKMPPSLLVPHLVRKLLTEKE
jgi:hypothetical protein